MANLFIETGASNMVYFNMTEKYSIAGHTALAFGTYLLGINSPGAENIDSKYRYYLSQKVGIGRKFLGKKSSNGFFLMTGVEHRAFKGDYTSPDNDLIESSGKQTHLSLGILYALQTKLTKSRGFSFRVYIPFQPYHIVDNIVFVTFDFGIRINLKND